MPNLPDFLVNYHLQIEWLLTLYPIKETIHLNKPMMTGGHAFMESKDFVHDQIQISERVFTSQLQLLNTNILAGFISVTVNQDTYYSIDLEVHSGTSKITRSFLVLPGTTIPFMVNSLVTGEEYLTDAALVYQGVCNAGERINLLKTSTTMVKNFFRIK